MWKGLDKRFNYNTICWTILFCYITTYQLQCTVRQDCHIFIWVLRQTLKGNCLYLIYCRETRTLLNWTPATDDELPGRNITCVFEDTLLAIRESFAKLWTVTVCISFIVGKLTFLRTPAIVDRDYQIGISHIYLKSYCSRLESPLPNFER